MSHYLENGYMMMMMTVVRLRRLANVLVLGAYSAELRLQDPLEFETNYL